MFQIFRIQCSCVSVGPIKENGRRLGQDPTWHSLVPTPSQSGLQVREGVTVPSTRRWAGPDPTCLPGVQEEQSRRAAQGGHWEMPFATMQNLATAQVPPACGFLALGRLHGSRHERPASMQTSVQCPCCQFPPLTQPKDSEEIQAEMSFLPGQSLPVIFAEVLLSLFSGSSWGLCRMSLPPFLGP